MEYTKKDLLKMKKNLYELIKMERRYNKFVGFTRLGAMGSFSGTAVSLSLYLNKTLELEKALTIGSACLVTSGICLVAGHFVGKEAQAVADDTFEFVMSCPEEVVEEVYASVYKR